MSNPRRESAGAGAGIGHSSAISARRGVNFLGYRVWPTHKLLRRRSVIRARRAVSALQARGDAEGLARFVAAWSGHARWADSYNLLQKLGLTMEVGR